MLIGRDVDRVEMHTEIQIRNSAVTSEPTITLGAVAQGQGAADLIVIGYHHEVHAARLRRRIHAVRRVVRTRA